MKQRKWFFKNGTCFEVYNILFDNGRFMLVQNDNSKKYSFGLCNDFGTLYGFPVNWSYLTADKCNDVLNGLIKIDSKKEYACLREFELKEYGYTSIDQWQAMINALRQQTTKRYTAKALILIEGKEMEITIYSLYESEEEAKEGIKHFAAHGYNILKTWIE